MANITLVLNDAEQHALNRLFDSMLRQAGLSVLDVVAHFVTRMAQADVAPSPGTHPKEAENQTTVPIPPATIKAATNSGTCADTSGQSILGHLIGEIRDGGRSDSGTQATASDGTVAVTEGNPSG